MRLDDWQALGIVCGSLIAAMTLIGLLYRWVVRPVWRTLRRLNEVADALLGEPAREGRPAVPSMMDRMKSLERQLDEHLAWHHPPKANSPAPLRTRRTS